MKVVFWYFTCFKGTPRSHVSSLPLDSRNSKVAFPSVRITVDIICQKKKFIKREKPQLLIVGQKVPKLTHCLLLSYVCCGTG